MNYSLFNLTDGYIILEFFNFPEDIVKAMRYLLGSANDKYFLNCKEQGKSSDKLGGVIIKKDPDGKCYLKVIGNDNHTILIIRQNDSRYEAYKSIIGKKITEEEFRECLNATQLLRLKNAHIPSRFLKEVLPLPDLIEERNIPLLISYYQYLNDYQKTTIVFDEPENTVSPAQKTNPTSPRKNPVIPWEQRQQELLKREPKRVIRFEGSRTSTVFEAYIYERDGETLAIVEPESGIAYQYNLNLGFVDKYNQELIEEMIKAALEASEEVVMLDDAIMRKNHTTLEAFKENLDVFLDNAKTCTKFYYDVRNAKNVYGR